MSYHSEDLAQSYIIVIVTRVLKYIMLLALEISWEHFCFDWKSYFSKLENCHIIATITTLSIVDITARFTVAAVSNMCMDSRSMIKYYLLMAIVVNQTF